MFTEKQLENYADVLVWGLRTARERKYRKGDIVSIRYNLPAIRLVENIYAKLLRMGIRPVLRADLSSVMERCFFEISDSGQLKFIPPGEKILFRHLNGSIVVHAPESMTHLSGIDPKKIGEATLARKPLRDLLDKRDEKGLFGWTLCIFPTPEMAGHAGLTIKEYTRQIVNACYLDRPSPVSEWEAVFKNAVELKKWLNAMKVEYYHIESENVDLKITPGEKRKWVGLSGHNIPSFELFISPDWRGTDGVYFADQPSYRSGNLIHEIRLIFKKGSAVEMSAKKGGQFLKKQLSIDKGADKVGEFSLTDKRFSKIDRFMANTLFDENYGGKYGNCHLALGSSYSDTYRGDVSELTKGLKKKLGFNDSALHWDMVNTEKKRVTAHLKGGKEKTIYENGLFQY
ncbi:MAG: aminopeptidase [Pseudomonadota bacterium]